MKHLKYIAPDYPRIPHVGDSNMTADDIKYTENITFPFTCYAGEKVDGANSAISWYDDAPILRNRNHVLKKGFDAKTPAKRQFLSAWNYVHEHKKDIEKIIDIYGSQLCVYGEWMFAEHSIAYDKLPDLFIAYDIYSPEEGNFLSPEVVEKLLVETNIKFIKFEIVTFRDFDDIRILGEAPSSYRVGMREGIVLKTVKDTYVDKTFKFVNKHFVRREGFNDELRKNIVKKDLVKLS